MSVAREKIRVLAMVILEEHFKVLTTDMIVGLDRLQLHYLKTIRQRYLEHLELGKPFDCSVDELRFLLKLVEGKEGP